MRLQAVLIVCLVLVGAGRAGANDYVVVRGAYYREASTRVIQPMVELQREAPGSGVDVAAHFLVDAITSASIAAGTAVDNVFTEIRDEVGLRVRKRWQRSDLALSYRYSAESDYWSHGFAASFGHRFWEDTASVRVSAGRSFDAVTANGRLPVCRPGADPMQSCALNVWFGGISYSQVLSPVAIAQVSYEAAYVEGYQGNPYRMVTGAGGRVEQVPEKRMRNAITPRIAYYLPGSGTGLQLNYRFYFDYYPGNAGTPGDPWQIFARTIEARVYQQLLPSLEARVLFRYYHQNHAQFWCDAATRPVGMPTDFCLVNTDPPAGYPSNAKYFAADPKLGPVVTQYPEMQLVWQAEALRDVPFLRWFSAGAFEISYGYYFQNTSFGGAHLLQTGYRLAY